MNKLIQPSWEQKFYTNMNDKCATLLELHSCWLTLPWEWQ